MPVAGDTAIHLSPRMTDLPLGALVEAWRRADFEPGASAAVLEQWLEKFAVPRQWFQPSEISTGGSAATHEFLFHDPMALGEWDWRLTASSGQSRFSAQIPQSRVEQAAGITRALHGFEDERQFAAVHGPDLDSQIQGAIGSALSRGPDFGTWPRLEACGIYRREHASVAFRTPDASVLFDPQGYGGSRTTALGRYPADHDPRVDAVIITHGHADHWHLPSVLRHCDASTRVIVPQVPRVNVLTPVDFSAALAAAGQEHVCLQWHHKVRVGDIEIQALPFHGEQPAGGADDAVRIWSISYALRCAKFSALVLVDGGIDPHGKMRDTVRDLVARDGAFDVVLSSCGRQAVGPTSPAFLLALPFARLREIHVNRQRDYRDKITQGIACVAEICAIAKARYFLPIAHGFNGLEEEIFIDSQQSPESILLTALEIELRRVGAPTQIAFWWVGDRFPIGDVDLPD